MRTSPLSMRRPRRRAPFLLVSSLALVALIGAGCSDDGDDEGSNPTTTSPTTTEVDGGDDGSTTTEAVDDETSTSEAAATEPTEPGAVPGDEVGVLSAEQAQAQLEALVGVYRQGIAEAAAAQALDERTLATFSGAFTGARANTELSALQAAGVEVLNPNPPQVNVADVEVSSTSAGCAAGTATIEGISGFVTIPVDTIQPYYFRLVPAAEGAAAPAWRLEFLNFSNNGEPLGEATCA